MFLAVSTLRKAHQLQVVHGAETCVERGLHLIGADALLGVHGRTQRTNRNERDQAQATLLAGFTLQSCLRSLSEMQESLHQKV